MERPKQPPRAEAGVVIGGYELVRRLGRGGMADVWVARRMIGASKFVAIKLLADHYVGDERYTRMFRAEAELAAILSHANIVQVFDEGEEDGRSYLVMEWVDGINLLKLGAVLALLDDEERRFRVIAYIIGQLLYALGYAHSITSYDGSPLGVVHRDVSPQNVLISNHGEVKLTDFGVAYHVMEESSGIHVKGKIRYMSPEQIGGHTRSPTVDLFAVGALLHELIDGKRFRHEYDDGQELITAAVSGAIPPLTRSIPPELDELRLRLLAPNPAERIQTAAEALSWLQCYPDYGDARGELTTLCSTFTGIVRPRAGPGQSSQVPMADRRTTQFKGPRLARPRMVEPGRPPAPPGSVTRAKPGPSRPAAALADESATAAVITGDTEFVRVGVGKKQVFGGPSGATTTPMPRRGRNLAVAPGVAASAHAGAVRSGVPVLGAGASVAPGVAASAHAGAVRSGVPVLGAGASVAPGVAASAHAAAPFVSQEIVDSRSHPIAVPTQAFGMPVPTVPPTERLGPSEASGASSGPMATEVVDASMIVEVSSNSGTDRDVAPVVAARDGTDPSREIRSAAVLPSHSINIVVKRRSAIAMLVVGLMLVAATSVTVTWWIFTRNKDQGEDRQALADLALESSPSAPGVAPKLGEAAVADVEAKRAEVSLGPPAEPDPAVVEPSAAVSPGAGFEVVAEGDGAAGGAGEAGGAAGDVLGAAGGAGAVDGAAGGAEPPGEAPDAAPADHAPRAVEEVSEPPSADDEEPAQASVDARDEPSAEEAEAPKAPPPKVAVTVSALPTIATGQLKLGRTQFDIPKGQSITKKLSPGKKKVQWRTDSKAPWKTATSIVLETGKPISIQLMFTGPRTAPK